MSVRVSRTIALALVALVLTASPLLAQATYKQRIGVNNAIGQSNVRYYEMPADESMLKVKLAEFQEAQRKAEDYIQTAESWLAENESSASADQIRFAKDNIGRAKLSILNAKVNLGAIEDQLAIVRARAANRPTTQYRPQIASEFAGTKWRLPNWETLWLKKNGRYEKYEADLPGVNSNEFGTWTESNGTITIRKDGTGSKWTLTIDNGRLRSGREYLTKQ